MSRGVVWGWGEAGGKRLRKHGNRHLFLLEPSRQVLSVDMGYCKRSRQADRWAIPDQMREWMNGEVEERCVSS